MDGWVDGYVSLSIKNQFERVEKLNFFYPLKLVLDARTDASCAMSALYLIAQCWSPCLLGSCLCENVVKLTHSSIHCKTGNSEHC